MLLTFSMRRVDVGRLLRSAWQDMVLQRRHCLSKDWPCSQADATQVCDFWFDLLMLGDCVMWESGGACVGWREARFEAPEMSADALRRNWLQQCCGHFQPMSRRLFLFQLNLRPVRCRQLQSFWAIVVHPLPRRHKQSFAWKRILLPLF
jgi:hypothetical protein